MTCAELIAELQRHPPAKPVHVVLRTVYTIDEAGESALRLGAEDALEADDVRNEGGFVLIYGGRA